MELAALTVSNNSNYLPVKLNDKYSVYVFAETWMCSVTMSICTKVWGV